MSKDNIEAAMRSLGLTEYQAAVYAALCQLGSGSAVELAGQSGVPRARIYDVLRDLESEGYVETYEQDSLSARVINVEDIESRLTEHADLITKAADDIDNMVSQPNFDDTDVTLVKREESVLRRAKKEIADAKTKIQLGVTPTQFDELRDDLVDAKDREVFIRITLFPHTPGNSVNIDSLDIQDVANEVRKQTLPAQFVTIVDQSTALFNTNNNVNRSNFGIIANNPALTYIFNWYFSYAMWSGWEVIYSEHNDEPPVEYIDIEQCVYDIYPIVDDGREVYVTVEGKKPDTGEFVSISGTVKKLRYGRTSREQDMSSYPANFSDVTAIIISTGNTNFSVGGWIPSVEDIEMHRITIESIK